MAAEPDSPMPTPSEGMTFEWHEGTGWVEIPLPPPEAPEIPPRPEDADGHTWEWADGAWVQRLCTEDELAEREADAERASTRTVVRTLAEDLQEEAGRAQAVLDSLLATPREKDLARSVKRLVEAVGDLARYLQP